MAPSSATSPLQRREMLERRFRTLRMVATWCVRRLWSSFFSSARSTSLNQASRSANDVTVCTRSSIGSWNFLSRTFSLMKSISAFALASMSSLFSRTSAYWSTSRRPQVSAVTLSSNASLLRSVLSETPSDLYGAKYRTSPNGSGTTSHLAYSARSASSISPGRSRKQRSGPFTLKHTAATLPFCAGKWVKMDCSSHSTALVLVARPETPVMFRRAASGPMRKSASR